MSKHWAFITIGLWLAISLSTTSWSHPGHASEAELDWNSAESTMEVSLWILPEQLEEAIGFRLGRPEAEAAISAYLRRHFRVVDAQGVAGTLDLLGIEAEYRRSWLYFTVKAAASSAIS